MALPEKDFISIIRLGIDSASDFVLTNVDWTTIGTLAYQSGLLAVSVDGVERLPEAVRPPKSVMLKWIGTTLQCESVQAKQQKVSGGMAKLFHQNGIKTYVLKGVIVAECYPRPQHRFSADMDCFLLPREGVFDAWARGNSLIREKGYRVGEGFYKNSAFHLPGLMVENHKFLTPFRGNKKLRNLEVLLQRMLKEDKGEDMIDGTFLYRPPVMVSALFLIEHSYSHFLHEGLTWKMVLDWMMFSKKHVSEIDWNQLNSWIDEFGFRKFYDSYIQLGKYLLGEMTEADLSTLDKLMLRDVWAPLDVLETLQGVKAKFQLAGNYVRARWKYKYFTDKTWTGALMEWVVGALTDRDPKLD